MHIGINGLLFGAFLSLASVADEILGVDPQRIAELGGNLHVTDGEVVLSLPKKMKFDFDSDLLSSTSSPEILANILISSELPLLLTIEGHTDEVGSDQYNYGLSKSRAETLKSELLRLGVDADTVVVVPRSETMPIEASGKESAVNRRLELKFSHR